MASFVRPRIGFFVAALVVFGAGAFGSPAGASPGSAGDPVLSSPPGATAADTYDYLGLRDDASRRSTGLLGSSLLDPSRLSFRNSLSFGYRSGTGPGRSAGLWLGEVGYRLSRPLYMSVDVGAAYVPGEGQSPGADNVFLHGFSLDYRPSRHFQMSLSYRNVPAAAAPAYWMGRQPYGFGSRGWWGDADPADPLPTEPPEAP